MSMKQRLRKHLKDGIDLGMTCTKIDLTLQHHMLEYLLATDLNEDRNFFLLIQDQLAAYVAIDYKLKDKV